MRQLFHNMSIRKKLFAMILVILTFNFLLLVLLGSTLFQSFYEGNKVRELRGTASEIVKIYSQSAAQTEDALYNELESVENRNNEVIIFRMDTDAPDTTDILYHSRMKNTLEAFRIETAAGTSNLESSPLVPSPTEPSIRYPVRLQPLAFVPIYDPALLAQLPSMETGELLVNTDRSFHDRGSRISIISRLESDVYLVIDTPREYITETADLAVQYSAFISIGVLFVGAVVIYWLSGRFTKPIREMDAVAQQIAQLDFSSSCDPRGNDELGALGASINHMSAALQESITLLQDDLARQQETDRMRRQFISDVSHDFKTPLTLMISYAEAIRDGREPDKTSEFCEIITDEGNRLSRLVGRLLELSRLESGMSTLELVPFSLNQLLDDTLRAMQLATEGKGIAVTRSYGGEVIVSGDYSKLGQVIYNLLDNAVKYTPDGGSIAITTRQLDGNLVEVELYNSDSHIDEGELDSIFASFYRADRSRERAQQSYGLGLAIVKTVLGLHGQDCIVSNVNDGVLFRFTLPTVELDDEDAE